MVLEAKRTATWNREREKAKEGKETKRGEKKKKKKRHIVTCAQCPVRNVTRFATVVEIMHHFSQPLFSSRHFFKPTNEERTRRENERTTRENRRRGANRRTREQENRSEQEERTGEQERTRERKRERKRKQVFAGITQGDGHGWCECRGGKAG